MKVAHRSRRLPWAAPGATRVLGLLILAGVLIGASDALAAPEAPRRAALVLTAPPRTSTKAAMAMEAAGAKVASRLGLHPTPGPLFEERMAQWQGQPVAECIDEERCLQALLEHLAVDVLLTVRVEAMGQRFKVTARVWHPRVDGGWTKGKPQPRRRVAPAVGNAVESAVQRFQKAWKKSFSGVASAASEPAPSAPDPEEMIEAELESLDPPPPPPRAPVDPEPAAAARMEARPTETFEAVEASTATPVRAAADAGTQRVTLVGDEPEDSAAWGFQIGVAPALFPVQHRQSPLAVGRTVSSSDLGTFGVGLALRLRFGGLPFEESYLTLWGAYALDDPLVVISAGVGVEKRWAIDRWFPLVGARYVLGVVGLPVPTSAGETLAWALNHGVEAYAGVAVSLEPVPLQLQLEAGYRLHPQQINQFSANGATYFSRDPARDVWIVDLSGPTARLVVMFAWG